MDEDVIEILSGALGLSKVPAITGPPLDVNLIPCSTRGGPAAAGSSSGWINNTTLKVSGSCPDSNIVRVATCILAAREAGKLSNLVAIFFEAMTHRLEARRSVLPRRKSTTRMTHRAARAVIARMDGTPVYPEDLLDMVRYQADREAMNAIPNHRLVTEGGDEVGPIAPAGAAALFLSRVDDSDWVASFSARGVVHPDPAASGDVESTLVNLLYATAQALLAPAHVTASSAAQLRSASLISAS